MVLACYRHIVPADNSTRAGKWEKKKFMGRELTGKTVGIVGLGNIGQLLVRRLSGFETAILGYDPAISEERARELGVTLVPLEELFARADIISLHVPENDDTRGMVNRQLLERMKPGAVLVNCARAGILVEEDLRAVKQEKELYFCTDVYPEDAPGPKSCADIADVMLPHLGASTVEANRNAALRAACQLIDYFEKGITRYVVNKAVPDGLDESYQHLAYQITTIARAYLGADATIRQIEASFYGGLDQFAKWFMPPIVAALSHEFDLIQAPEEAEEYLRRKGIAFDVREADDSKGYGKSMTIDLLEGGESPRRISVRGTIAESAIVISRIGEFDRLYFQPSGHYLIVEYKDRPGVLAKITAACAERNINIEDIRAPRNPSGTRALAVLKLDQPAPADMVERIRRETHARAAFSVSF